MKMEKMWNILFPIKKQNRVPEHYNLNNPTQKKKKRIQKAGERNESTGKETKETQV